MAYLMTIPNLTAWLLVLIAAINSTIGNLLLKQSRLGVTGEFIKDFFLNPWFLGGLVFYGINVILFSKALDKIPISQAYPVLAGLGFLALSVSATIIFHERLNLIQCLGIIQILIGILILTKGG